jgi:hypothetical protein
VEKPKRKKSKGVNERKKSATGTCMGHAPVIAGASVCLGTRSGNYGTPRAVRAVC